MSGLVVGFIEQDGEVISHAGFVKLARFVVFELCHPGWRAVGLEDKSELFVASLNPDVFDVAASQTTTLYEAIARRAWPADLH